uniref:Uncharacterized protein n=1 Tax=Brassica oleracea var. oleracea TaxID=109376 RepID=A0A0D3BYW7_BRAOL
MGKERSENLCPQRGRRRVSLEGHKRQYQRISIVPDMLECCWLPNVCCSLVSRLHSE